MSKKMISVAKDFSINPLGRNLKDGPNTGERFREEVLIPALKSFDLVEIDLDGALGFGSSFLEEAFGGLIRLGYKAADLRKRLKIKSSINVYIDRIWRYIDEAAARSPAHP